MSPVAALKDSNGVSHAQKTMMAGADAGLALHLSSADLISMEHEYGAHK